MARHFDEGTDKRSGVRPLAVVAIVLLCAVVCAGAYVLLSGRPSEEAPEPETPIVSGQEEDPQGEGETPSVDESGLPFSLDGVDLPGEAVEVSGEAQEASVSGEWTFGGDYANIGSFPIDGQTVFGSSSNTPDDLSSYVASLIGPSGFTALESAGGSDVVFEPQDGTGDADRVVWRSTELTFQPVQGEDNWRLHAWDAASGTSRVLGTAEALNGTDKTPLLDGEVVPTANDEYALYASNVKDGDGWVASVLAYDLAQEGGEPVVVGEGCYPAAVDGGAYWAGDGSVTEEGTFYQTLYRWDGSESSKVFSVASESGTWGVTGVWACGDSQVVCLSSNDPAAGAYIGVWTGDFGTCAALLHVASSTVVGSVNANWFVWGSGSQAENTQMYALRIADGEVCLLGDAVGYSRPQIARDCDAVLIPVSDGVSAASFRVGVLE